MDEDWALPVDNEVTGRPPDGISCSTDAVLGSGSGKLLPMAVTLGEASGCDTAGPSFEAMTAVGGGGGALAACFASSMASKVFISVFDGVSRGEITFLCAIST